MNGTTEGITDISFKEDVFREATATGFLRLSQKSLRVVSDGRSVKGDVREASNIAAILAVKETPRTIPHCHPIPIEACSVRHDSLRRPWKVTSSRSTTTKRLVFPARMLRSFPCAVHGLQRNILKKHAEALGPLLATRRQLWVV